MLAFSNDYYGIIFRATQSVELFCAYFNAAVYDAISIAISDKIMEDETFTITTQMKQRLKQLFFNDDFIDSINGSTNDKSKILKRIKIVKGVLK